MLLYFNLHQECPTSLITKTSPSFCYKCAVFNAHHTKPPSFSLFSFHFFSFSVQSASMASSSSPAPADQPESESQGMASRCSSCLGWVSSFIPCCSVQSNSRASASNAVTNSISTGPLPERESTPTADLCRPDNEASTSIAAGRLERGSSSRVLTSTTMGALPDNEASTSIAADRSERESGLRASTSTADNEATTSTTGSRPAFHGIAPSPSSSASKRNQKQLYDVFISHRGPDVKYTLASVLYGILTGMSLSVFLDSEELEYGDFLPETIQAAMAGALLHIAIFSKGYAESPWCLAELAFMLKSGAKIIPIFYYVDTSDLRRVDQGKGVYVHAFQEHQRKGRYTPQQLHEWMSALHNVSFYTGQIIQTDEDEKRLLKNIVRCVLKEINDKVPLVVAKHPVGLEEIVQEFNEETLKSDKSENGDQNVPIVGIWGMGGSGKTTLAKELYNQISSSMDRSSFVFDVRDAATKGLLHEKQKKLLKDIGIENVEVDNIEEGVRNLSRDLRSSRVLIVLDDVDNVEQLNALLPIKDSVARGSLIIVTTRACDVLKLWGISSIYKMKPLKDLYAKQFFCWHAFLKSYPSDGFEELVDKFTEVCTGLPLSLKVFGARLYGETRKDIWKSLLDKMSKMLSDDIKQTLKISYDTLDDEEKNMFLDSACFFIGEQCGLAIEIWEGMGCSALQSWETLLNRCLVELDDDNFIRMHDHLRDLGRDIANKQSPYRLWFPQQQIYIQNQIQITIDFQGIIATSDQIEWDYYNKDINSMIEKMEEVDEFGIRCLEGKLMVSTSGGFWPLTPSLIGLKYLVISGDYFNQVMGDISSEVIWVRWFQIGQRTVPSELSMKKLRVLEIFESDKGEHHLKQLWSVKQPPLQLRQLLISHCHEFQGFPNSIGDLRYLKKIVIIGGLNVRSLPDEFCLLQSLEYLVLDQCKMLSSLPSDFGNLRNLRHLRLSDWHKLKRLPDSFKNLKLLEYLSLTQCYELTFRSEDLNCLENITKLECLKLGGCRQLEELPRHITNQASLRELDFSGTSIRELPDNIGQLTRLRELWIEGVPSTSLPTSFGDLSSLTKLTFLNCDKLERLPDSIGNLSFLTKLSFDLCDKLERLPDSIGNLSSLTELTFWQCDKLERLPDSIGNLCSLTELSVKLCDKLERLPDSIGNLSSLKELSLWQCDKLERLPDSIGNLSSLTELSLWQCDKLERLPDSIGNLSSLTKLTFRNCYKLRRLPDSIGNLSSLTSLSICFCDLKSLPESLGDLSSLTVLEVNAFTLECEVVKSLPKLIRRLNNLERLDLIRIPINEIDFRGSSNMKKIYLNETEVCRISLSEACCPHLESLRVFNNNHLTQIEALPRTLKTIRLENCEALKNIPSFAGLTCLTNFHLEGCYGIEKIQGLENCTGLEKLFAETWWEVPGIEEMQKLKELVLKANKGTVIEHCIQRLQTLPDVEDIMIFAGAVPDAASLVEGILLSQKLVIVDSISNQNMKVGNMEYESGQKSVLKFGMSDGDAIMFCFVVNCVSSQMSLEITVDGWRSPTVELRKGRWAVVSRHSRIWRSERSGEVRFFIYHGEGEMEKGLVVRGAQQTAMEALCSLLPIFS